MSKIKKVMKATGRGIKNVAIIGVATITSLAAAESAFAGTYMLSNDAELVGKAVKHKVSPEPVYVKKGLMGKKEIKTINPFTGKIENYHGTKKPVCDKPIRVK